MQSKLAQPRNKQTMLHEQPDQSGIQPISIGNQQHSKNILHSRQITIHQLLGHFHQFHTHAHRPDLWQWIAEVVLPVSTWTTRHNTCYQQNINRTVQHGSLRVHIPPNTLRHPHDAEWLISNNGNRNLIRSWHDVEWVVAVAIPEPFNAILAVENEGCGYKLTAVQGVGAEFEYGYEYDYDGCAVISGYNACQVRVY